MAGRRTLGTASPRVAATIALPPDVTTQLPVEARTWLGQYSLGRLDLQQNHVMWSDKWSRIIFPYFNETGLIAWQGRYIPCGLNKVEVNGKAPAKWFSQGKIHEIVHPIKVVKREAVLVEDIVSAIKVSRYIGTIPIFWSTVSYKQLIAIHKIVDRVWVWLDPNVRTTAVSMAFTGNLLGLESSVIFSDKDPKEHTDEEIQELLDKHTK